ncbi:hypothetical protein IJH33_00465 [Candidatus Saccharibacteria bacterium]|nr:hypothetical protein [Candidatus Saccharibacteria bacterium]
MKKAIIAAGASAVLAAMPVVGVFATDITSIEDTISVTISPTCSFNTNNSASASNTEFAATVTNGSEAAFNNSGAHVFNVTCNDNDGYSVTATPTNLVGEGVSTNNIPYTTSYSAAGTAGMWSAVVTSSDIAAAGLTTPVPAIDAESHVIATEDSATANSTFTVTYSVYVGTETPADTYTGTMTYGLSTL